VRKAARALAGRLGLAALLLAAALPAAAEVRRFEVVGAVVLDPAAPPKAPRQAALRAALQEAVSRASLELVREATGKEPEPGAPSQAPEGEPTEYAVSYRILEDRGEQAALVAGGPEGGREYVVVAEVQIDLDRLRASLREAGRLGAEPAPSVAAASFRLEVLGLPSPAAWTALRGALRGAGAQSVVPVEIEAGRALLEIQAPGGSERLVERLLHATLPEGLALEALPAEGGTGRLRVRQGAQRLTPGTQIGIETGPLEPSGT
jgi:hypothetical protein